MKLILLKTVNKLGSKGAIIEAADGYARNFLLPRGLAVLPDDLAVKKLQRESRLAEGRIFAKRSQAEKISKLLNGRSLRLKRPANEKGILYSQVSAKDITGLIKETFDAEVAPDKLKISHPLKQTGKFQLFFEVDSSRIAFELVIDAIKT